MLTISRGHMGMGEKEAGMVSSLADSMSGVEAGIWCRMNVGNNNSVPNSKPSPLAPKRDEGKEGSATPTLPAKRRRSEDSLTPGAFGVSAAVPPASPNFSLSAGNSDVFAAPQTVKKQVRQEGGSIQPSSFQPIVPHAPPFKDNSPGTRESDFALLRTPDGWHPAPEDGVVGIGGSPCILPPDSADFKLQGRQSTDWDFPRSGSHDPDRSSSLPKQFETPFELCCITPTHSLFSSNEKARPKRGKETPPSVPKAEIMAESPAVPRAVKANSESGVQTQTPSSEGVSANGKGNGTPRALEGKEDRTKRKPKNGKFDEPTSNPSIPSPFTAVSSSRKSGEPTGHFPSSSGSSNKSQLSSNRTPTSRNPPMGPSSSEAQQWSDEGSQSDSQSSKDPGFQLSQPGAQQPRISLDVNDRPPLSKDKSGRSARYKGVTWDRVKRMWRVRLCLQGGARQHVGYYQDEEEGAIAYVNALSVAKAQGLSLKSDSMN